MNAEQKNHLNQNSFTQRAAMRMIKMYQMCISPFIGGRCACRFSPTCSEYTKIAISRYGTIRGIYMGLRRIIRCRPGGGWGYDPVP